MGFFKWLNENVCGPESICKTLLRAYQIHKISEKTQRDALRKTLASRYTVLKTIRPSQYEEILDECHDLGTLALACTLAEQPNLGGENLIRTMVRIGDYFAKSSPQDAEGIAEILAFIQKYADAVAAGDKESKINLIVLSVENKIPMISLVKSICESIDYEFALR